jgi:hypothetical protein
MIEVLRANDPVLLSFAEAALRDAGYEPFLMDIHMAALDGSVAAIPRRLMVAGDDAAGAKAALDAALKSVEGGV